MIAEHGGRIIDTAGDGILAEFGSVVNAVECAVALQKTMAERNSTIEATRQMQFRIGINLGDVIHDEARVYGDGVNIAAGLRASQSPVESASQVLHTNTCTRSFHSLSLT